LSNIFQKTYQNWLLPLFLHEIEALWLLSQTVRIRFHPDSERELCVNSGARQKQRVRAFETDFFALSGATLKVAFERQKSFCKQGIQGTDPR